jgi:hypothetical protein
MSKSISWSILCLKGGPASSTMTISNIYRHFKSIHKSILPHRPELMFSCVFLHLLKIVKMFSPRSENFLQKLPRITNLILSSIISLNFVKESARSSVMFKLLPYFWVLTSRVYAKFKDKFLKGKWIKFTA